MDCRHSSRLPVHQLYQGMAPGGNHRPGRNRRPDAHGNPDDGRRVVQLCQQRPPDGRVHVHPERLPGTHGPHRRPLQAIQQGGQRQGIRRPSGHHAGRVRGIPLRQQHTGGRHPDAHRPGLLPRPQHRRFQAAHPPLLRHHPGRHLLRCGHVHERGRAGAGSKAGL